VSDNFPEEQAAGWRAIVTQMLDNPDFYFLNGSVNGPGSSLKYTEGLRRRLPDLLRRYRITTMLDAPCGDMTWLSQTDLTSLHSYLGYDVDQRIIKANKNGFRELYQFAFLCTNLLTRPKFPKVDLILCRDFLAHLTDDYIGVMLDKFTSSGSTYLLASNYPGSANDFVYVPEDFPWRGYLERPHDLTQQPFNLRRIDGIPEESPPGGILANQHELALFQLGR
jgi:hypothetical protein